MNVIERVATRLPQVEVQWLGGLKTIAGRLTFYRGFLTFLMIIPVAYESAIVKSVFPTLWSFVAAMAGALGLAAIAEYGIIYPSQIKFNKSQAAKNDRDPIYERTRRIESQLEDVKASLDDQQRPVADGCGCIELAEQLSEQREDDQ
ncbi:hypothetical protein [Haloarcula argentinensis]|uniref:Uncharacterized protein n=1 Tax=Haloarcula argentinensis TaxID=43776 RepID=A0A847UQG8_HALAR|nr:hypothetical protein [Haloarcula argentinensis]NLV14364.1 hypothetical protein [Haloarcula argentinensis]